MMLLAFLHCYRDDTLLFHEPIQKHHGVATLLFVIRQATSRVSIYTVDVMSSTSLANKRHGRLAKDLPICPSPYRGVEYQRS